MARPQDCLMALMSVAERENCLKVTFSGRNSFVGNMLWRSAAQSSNNMGEIVELQTKVLRSTQRFLMTERVPTRTFTTTAFTTASFVCCMQL